MKLDMLEEAAEFMRRVNPNSGSGTDAATWLSFLENDFQAIDGTILTDELPGFCLTLINSKVWLNGVLQAQAN